MELTFAPKGILQIDDARLFYKNFSGVASKYNREGDRNFVVIIPDTEMADALVEDGWNVKAKPPRDEGEDLFMYLPVKVKFNDRGPHIYLKSGESINKLDEETISCLDDIDILNVDLDIRPYNWEVNGKTGKTAYLQSMEVTQKIDRFAKRYEGEIGFRD